MAHPYSKHNEAAAGKAKAASMTKGYKKGGAVHSDEAQDRKLIKSMMDKEEKSEPKVEGKASGGRLDKFARGGGTKGKGKHKGGNHVNVVIAAPHGSPPGMGAAPADPAGGLPPPPGGGLPPGPPMGMPPGGPPGMPPGQPPMKRGGRAYAAGGKVKMTAGAQTGEGRLEKKKAYGLKPIKG